jgi:hypothetical protein
LEEEPAEADDDELSEDDEEDLDASVLVFSVFLLSEDPESPEALSFLLSLLSDGDEEPFTDLSLLPERESFR